MPILVPLNTFKTLVKPVTNDVIALPTPATVPPEVTHVYTTGAGVSTVVLLSQFSNYTATNVTVSAVIYRAAAYSWLIKDFTIPAYDAGTILTGRLVLEEGNKLYVRASAASSVNFIFSYLETANA